MIPIQKFLTLLLIILAFVGCNEDDDSTQYTNNNSNGTSSNTTLTLIGIWNLLEYPGDDGKDYGPNEFIPFYDTTTVQGCSIFDNQLMYLEFRYSFQNDSLGSRFFSLAEKVRSYTVLNAPNCEINYDPWSTDAFSNGENFKYKRISPIAISLVYDGTTDIDTLNYSFNANVLTLSTPELSIKLVK